MSLYTELVAAGITPANHESDLQFPASKAALEILKRFPREHWQSGRFWFKREEWVEVPFAYDPWWEERSRNTQ